MQQQLEWALHLWLLPGNYCFPPSAPDKCCCSPALNCQTQKLPWEVVSLLWPFFQLCCDPFGVFPRGKIWAFLWWKFPRQEGETSLGTRCLCELHRFAQKAHQSDFNTIFNSTSTISPIPERGFPGIPRGCAKSPLPRRMDSPLGQPSPSFCHLQLL